MPKDQPIQPTPEATAGHPPSGSVARSTSSAEKTSNSDSSPLSKRSHRSKRSLRGKRHASAESRSESVGQASAPQSSSDDATERYQRIGEIGRGGWGVVEHAIDRQLQRPVAIKRIVPSRHLTEAVRDRFLHEAKVTSQLQHPGIVPVHELGEGDSGDRQSGDAYYVMKLLDGQPLRQWIRDTHQTCQQVDAGLFGRGLGRFFGSSHRLRDALVPLLERFVDVCHAIAYAHGRGILHRDLKPANVMVGEFGETIVVDWGLAKRFRDAETIRQEASIQDDLDQAALWIADIDADASRTRDGSVIGTPAYMPPEQAGGKVDAMTEASDIYSLGVMLYEIILGHHPFVGSDVPTTLDRVRRGDWKPAKDVRRDVPRALSAICEKAMSLAPADRYRSAAELADEVRRFVAGDAVRADRESWMDTAARWCRRHRALAISVAGTTLALLIASCIFGFFIHRSHQAERAARVETEAAHHETLTLLGESRSAADAWLIDLSGSLQFYPGLEPIRRQLIKEAIEHYENLIRRERHTSTTELSRRSAKHLDMQRRMEMAKVQIRLGDLYRLDDQPDQASWFYATADATLGGLDPQSFDDAKFRRDLRLQEINVIVGRLLSDKSIRGGVESHYRWLCDQLRLAGVPDASSRSDKPMPDFVHKLASCASRLNLAAGRALSGDRNGEHPSVADRTIDFHRRASRWSRWLAAKRGTPADHRLAETSSTELGLALERSDQRKAATAVWQTLVNDLQAQCESSPDRIDYQQSLAHARTRLAGQLARRHDRGGARRQYEQAIDELQDSWSLSDVDGFYQTNLATAENNLGLLLSVGDEAEKRSAADHLLRSLAIYRRMMQSRPTIDDIRRFSQTSAALASLHSGRTDDEVAKWLEDANLGYQLLQDHGRLNAADQKNWSSVKAHRDRWRAGNENPTQAD